MAKASEYWRKRLIRDQALAQRSADAVAAEMKREYRLHYAQVVKRLDSLYVEAQRRGELSRTKLWNYLSYRDMEEKLSDMVDGGSMIQRDKLTKTLNRVFEDVIGASADRFRREGFVLPYDPRAVIDTAWSGASYSERIWKNNERLAQAIRSGCRGIVMGLESPTTIKQRLMKDFDVTKSQAERLVDTETSYVFNKANLMKYQQSGRQKLTIVCRDVNTCDKCKALEGEVFLTMDAPVLPIHPRCHCAYCVPQELEDAEVTMSGSDLEAVYARKGVKGYGDAAQESALGAKLFQPKAARAAEVAKANGMIPASQLQRSVEKAMRETLPEMAEAVGEGARAEGTVSSFGAPSLPTDMGIAGLPEMAEDMGDPVLTAGGGSGIMETESPPEFKTEDEVKAWIASAACSKILRQGRQRVHIPGTKEHADNVAKYARRGEYGPSTLSISEEEAEALGLEYMGKGHLFIRENGWDGTETITGHGETIGEVTNNLSGKTVQTSVFKIHYSKKGFHIVPDYPNKKGE